MGPLNVFEENQYVRVKRGMGSSVRATTMSMLSPPVLPSSGANYGAGYVLLEAVANMNISRGASSKSAGIRNNALWLREMNYWIKQKKVLALATFAKRFS